MSAEARQLVEDIDRSLGPLHHHCVEWRRKAIDEDGLMLAALCGCVDDLVETLRLRIPPSLHPAAQESVLRMVLRHTCCSWKLSRSAAPEQNDLRVCYSGAELGS